MDEAVEFYQIALEIKELVMKEIQSERK